MQLQTFDSYMQHLSICSIYMLEITYITSVYVCIDTHKCTQLVIFIIFLFFFKAKHMVLMCEWQKDFQKLFFLGYLQMVL